jgi:hypothetical protein
MAAAGRKDPSMTDDTPERSRIRALLRAMGARLMLIHRALIADAAADWAIATGEPPPGPLELFRLLREDPVFAWLQPITTLIVGIGELASGDFEKTEAVSMSARVAALLDGGDPVFIDRYRALLQRDTEVAGAHAELRAAIKDLKSAL